MFFKRILEALSDDKGCLSSLRIVMILFAFAFAPTYIYLCILKGEMLPLPESVLGVIVTLIIGKLGQKKMELSEGKESEGYSDLSGPDI